MDQLPTSPLPTFADYGSEEAMMPPIADMEKFLKGQLDERLANGKAPLSLSTIYGWCAVLPGAAGASSLLMLPHVLLSPCCVRGAANEKEAAV
jgi:hypothetical protein